MVFFCLVCNLGAIHHRFRWVFGSVLFVVLLQHTKRRKLVIILLQHKQPRITKRLGIFIASFPKRRQHTDAHHSTTKKLYLLARYPTSLWYWQLLKYLFFIVHNHWKTRIQCRYFCNYGKKSIFSTLHWVLDCSTVSMSVFSLNPLG